MSLASYQTAPPRVCIINNVFKSCKVAVFALYICTGDYISCTINSEFNMSKSILKLRAQALRGRGKGIREIVALLGAPLSTVSYWCRDIILSQKQQDRLIKKQKDRAYVGRLRSAEVLRNKRINATQRLKEQGIKEIGRLNDREMFLLGVGLYWGEGYRKYEMVGFTSGDKDIVKYIMRWLRLFITPNNDDFVLRVSINSSHENRVADIERYWSKITEVSLSQFSKPSIVVAKQKKVYLNKDSYYGTLRIVVRRSVSLHRKLMGWIEGVNKN